MSEFPKDVVDDLIARGEMDPGMDAIQPPTVSGMMPPAKPRPWLCQGCRLTNRGKHSHCMNCGLPRGATSEPSPEPREPVPEQDPVPPVEVQFAMNRLRTGGYTAWNDFARDVDLVREWTAQHQTVPTTPFPVSPLPSEDTQRLDPSEEEIRAIFMAMGCCDGGDQCLSDRGTEPPNMEDCCRYHYAKMIRCVRALPGAELIMALEAQKARLLQAAQEIVRWFEGGSGESLEWEIVFAKLRAAVREEEGKHAT